MADRRWTEKKQKIFLNVLSQLFLKYAYTLDVLIHQFVHMEFSDSTLLILLNFKKKIFFNELELTSFKFSAIKSLEELTRWRQKIPCGQTDESKHVGYRHILKTVAEVL